MSHARTQIRNRFVTLLTGLTSTGANVQATRFYPVAEAALPALGIFTKDEELLEFTGNRNQLRQLDVEIAIYAKAVADVDTTVDTICKEIELALVNAELSIGLRNAYFHSLAVEFTDEDKPVARGTLIWRVEYEVNATDPEVIVST